jgi:uncharacterized membrane protein
VKTDVPAASGAGHKDSSTGASRRERGLDGPAANVCPVPPGLHSDPAESSRPHLKNIREILALETGNHRSLFDRLADVVSRVAGGLLFFLAHILWFAVWIAVNRRSDAFDPPPYNLLMLIVSLEAILLTGFVLRAQSRAAMLADRRAELDLQVNLLAEEELTAILRVLCAIGDKVGIDVASADPRVEQFRSQTNVREIAAELDREKAVAEAGQERIGREED